MQIEDGKWIYITTCTLPEHWLSGAISHETFRSHETWLIEQVGPEYMNWFRYKQGDIITGIFVNNPEIATMFKLRFGL